MAAAWDFFPDLFGLLGKLGQHRFERFDFFAVGGPVAGLLGFGGLVVQDAW